MRVAWDLLHICCHPTFLRKCVEWFFLYRKTFVFDLFLQQILGADQEGQACKILCELLERSDLAVKSEDVVFEKMTELQRIGIPSHQMSRIWTTCKFAYVSPACYREMACLGLFKKPEYERVQRSHHIHLMWSKSREHIDLERFLEDFIDSEEQTLWRQRLSPRRRYGHEVPMCKLAAKETLCPGVLEVLGTKLFKDEYQNPRSPQVQMLASRLSGTSILENILEHQESCRIQNGADDSAWFKVDLGPRKLLQPSHCCFQVRGCDLSLECFSDFPIFEASKDDITWHSSNLEAKWTKETKPDGWRWMTVKLNTKVTFRYFQLVLCRSATSKDFEVKGFELYGTLSVSNDRFTREELIFHFRP